MKLDHHQLGNLLRTLAMTADVEIDCDDCLATVAAYAESELAGKTPGEAFTQLQQHLGVCEDCREEYQALLEAMRGIDSAA